MTPDERTRELEVIGAEVRGCTRCRLHQGRTLAVPGEGHHDTEVVFVGEGPGFNEDQQGRPFVGAAGGLLTELLRSVGWSREEVFITNVVKCRPPGNRDPEPDEMAACRPYLERQLAVLDPALVVTLGRFSLGTFMPGARIGEVHGTARSVDPATGAPDAMAYAMYHPAAAFRQTALKETLFADMAGTPDALLASRDARETRRAGSDAVVAGTLVDEPAHADAGAEAPAEPWPQPAPVELEAPGPEPLQADPADHAHPPDIAAPSAGAPDREPVAIDIDAESLAAGSGAFAAAAASRDAGSPTDQLSLF